MRAEGANQSLVEQLIARGALWSPPLIDAFRATPRHLFLDRVYHHHPERGWREIDTTRPGRGELRLIYSDRALTTRLSTPEIERGSLAISSSSQPSLMAQILEDLRLAPGQRVLEVGAGTGYNAALLAYAVGGEGKVTSIDVDRVVLGEARRHLEALPGREVELRHGDGRRGYPDGAPFDRILATAATPDLEPAWLEQLAEGGLLEAPLDLAPGLSYLVCGTVREGRFEGRLLRPAYFMPLREEGTTGRGPTPLLPGPERMTDVPAPWAGWLGRRPTTWALSGGGLLVALAFLGWLEGLSVGYAILPDDRPAYGVGDLVRGQVCWVSARTWRVSGKAGHELGLRLWRKFLDEGGPWPTEFRLTAQVGEAARAEGRLAYRKQGARCGQVWELIEARERGGV